MNYVTCCICGNIRSFDAGTPNPYSAYVSPVDGPVHVCPDCERDRRERILAFLYPPEDAPHWPAYKPWGEPINAGATDFLTPPPPVKRSSRNEPRRPKIPGRA